VETTTTRAETDVLNRPFMRETQPDAARPKPPEPAHTVREPALSFSGNKVEFCEFLTQSGRITKLAFDRATHLSEESGEDIINVLTRLGFIGERDLTDALSRHLSLPIALSDSYPNEPVFENILSQKFLNDARVIPLKGSDGILTVAIVNPFDAGAVGALHFATGGGLDLHLAYPADLDAALERLYGDGKAETGITARETASTTLASGDDIDRLKDMASEAPVIRLANQLIARAVEARASDIHIEPMENELRVRYRVDGVLQHVESPPQSIASPLVSRIKIMAKLNIAERRVAQDGRIKLAVRGKDIDFRVSTVPTLHGESVVLRILDRGQLHLEFSKLGFDESLSARIREVLKQPYGILLVTGPTGSGKTTTLYTALLELNTPDRKILTIEDPVEYQLTGVNQVQVKSQIGLTFASALRSFLRQDPDVMLIGEIRDLETAQIAVQASLTGHLILSTLHTNDAASAVTRLLDMGVEDYLLTSTINGIVAQRLIRMLCLHCREAYRASPGLAARLWVEETGNGEPVTLYRPVGCPACNGTGYSGRSSIVEFLPVSDAIREAILKRRDANDILNIAKKEGMRSMQAHGMAKARAGLTSFEEVLRATRAT